MPKIPQKHRKFQKGRKSPQSVLMFFSCHSPRTDDRKPTVGNNFRYVVKRRVVKRRRGDFAVLNARLESLRKTVTPEFPGFPAEEEKSDDHYRQVCNELMNLHFVRKVSDFFLLAYNLGYVFVQTFQKILLMSP
jgi:hypothetical protein